MGRTDSKAGLTNSCCTVRREQVSRALPCLARRSRPTAANTYATKKRARVVVSLRIQRWTGTRGWVSRTFGFPPAARAPEHRRAVPVHDRTPTPDARPACPHPVEVDGGLGEFRVALLPQPNLPRVAAPYGGAHGKVAVVGRMGRNVAVHGRAFLQSKRPEFASSHRRTKPLARCPDYYALRYVAVSRPVRVIRMVHLKGGMPACQRAPYAHQEFTGQKVPGCRAHWLRGTWPAGHPYTRGHSACVLHKKVRAIAGNMRTMARTA